jgi:hypothetical protein
LLALAVLVMCVRFDLALEIIWWKYLAWCFILLWSMDLEE